MTDCSVAKQIVRNCDVVASHETPVINSVLHRVGSRIAVVHNSSCGANAVGERESDSIQRSNIGEVLVDLVIEGVVRCVTAVSSSFGISVICCYTV